MTVKYPAILGSDLAGQVVEVGRSVTHLKVGDRVVGHGIYCRQESASNPEAAFQNYTVVPGHMASKIPASLSYESACVIPLGLSTSACGLFQDDQLGLNYPSVDSKPTGKTLLIWGGSTSVGCNAIQLAAAAGYEVITTSSPRNFDYLKKLGASQVFDYNSKTVVEDIILAFKGKRAAGALSIGAGAADACRSILAKSKGNKFIAMASYPVPLEPPEHFALIKIAFQFVSWNIVHWVKSKMMGVRSKYIFGCSLETNGVGKAVYVDFLPKALEQGSFVAAPEPLVAGKGLGSIQEAFNLQREGVSAKKVVVLL